jgi:hypothetical protein
MMKRNVFDRYEKQDDVASPTNRNEPNKLSTAFLARFPDEDVTTKKFLEEPQIKTEIPDKKPPSNQKSETTLNLEDSLERYKKKLLELSKMPMNPIGQKSPMDLSTDLVVKESLNSTSTKPKPPFSRYNPSTPLATTKPEDVLERPANHDNLHSHTNNSTSQADKTPTYPVEPLSTDQRPSLLSNTSPPSTLIAMQANTQTSSKCTKREPNRQGTLQTSTPTAEDKQSQVSSVPEELC